MPGRNVDYRPASPQSEGFNQVTNLRSAHTPSMADGCCPAMAGYDAPYNTVGPASPGAVLGTGMNVDRYVPVVEAV